jgi:Immunoglobulin-like domain of bacterial spore germination
MSARIAGLAIAGALLAGCGGDGHPSTSSVCANGDGALDKAAFVFVKSPRSGERVLSDFRVTGCSSTFEANLNWRLRGRNGRILASGLTQGGSLSPGPFAFNVRYPIGARQVGQLEVYEPRVTDEGFPPLKNVLQLVLEP